MPIMPSTLLVTTVVWTFGVLPIIVLRKSLLTGEPINSDPSIPSYLLQLLPRPPPLLRNASKSRFPNHAPSEHSQCTFSQAFSFQRLISYLSAFSKVLPVVVITLESSSNRGTYSSYRDPPSIHLHLLGNTLIT
jgi:hypothetical protein